MLVPIGTRWPYRDANGRLRRWHTTSEACLVVPTCSARSAGCVPAAPAICPRNRHRLRRRESHAQLPSGRGTLSANAAGNANVHPRIRHRAFHVLRGAVAIATSTLRSCCTPSVSRPPPTKMPPAELSSSLRYPRLLTQHVPRPASRTPQGTAIRSSRASGSRYSPEARLHRPPPLSLVAPP